tara:strand:- start:345 stop:521 length:177 start_codon:yes stop_codon:yes gene_type:complete
LYDKVKTIKRIKKLESNLFITFCHETDKELEIRHEKGVLMHYLRALEKLKVEQSNDIK